ncbi:amino acid transporter heavy chain SLC3A2-like [Elgaria multicarinata webbii]|uniref:amino acid transporter heavy chain SLC3A2-like n=1 Tax=Elgaria multicarinata webbii TaxID=159646 RepID=UPI002FCD38D0
MGKVEDTAIVSQVPSEHLPLLSPAAPSTTYLTQEEVVQQASTAPWPGLRKALLYLLGVVFACMLSMAILLLLRMPRPRPPLAWWQKSSFYRLPPTSFPDSNGDGYGDLAGVSCQLDQLLGLSIQALVLGPILEGDLANLSSLLPAHGSLEQLQALANDGRKRGVRILLELPTLEENLDRILEDNQTDQHLKGAMQFWQAQGVHGFLVPKDPAWLLDAVLNAWSELDSEMQTDRGEERVLIVLDKSQSCNISRWVPSNVILACHLLEVESNLSAQALAQRVEEGTLRHPGTPWPGWMVPRGLPLVADLGEMLGVLLLSLPGVPLLQGGAGSPVPLDNELTKGSSNGHPLANLYRSLLALRANSFALRGVDFVSLPLADHSEDIFAYLRPGSCSDILVFLNLGSRPCQLNLNQLSIPAPAKVLFSTYPEPQKEISLVLVRLMPHQAVLLQVPRGYRP